jgi:hypothetical protein
VGRGRQKAKHTKVARELKYFSPNTDLSQLQRELGSSSTDEDAWAEYADKYGADDEDNFDDEE